MFRPSVDRLIELRDAAVRGDPGARDRFLAEYERFGRDHLNQPSLNLFPDLWVRAPGMSGDVDRMIEERSQSGLRLFFRGLLKLLGWIAALCFVAAAFSGLASMSVHSLLILIVIILIFSRF
jgi:hypothetical protein